MMALMTGPGAGAVVAAAGASVAGSHSSRGDSGGPEIGWIIALVTVVVTLALVGLVQWYADSSRR
jgi:hypothetical protein